MQIAIVIDTLTIGGAETFVLRLGEALVNRGYRVQIFVQRGDLINWKMVRATAPSVVIVPCKILLLSIVHKIDGLLFRVGSAFSLLRWIQAQKMKNFLSKNEIDLVHSNLITADIVTSKACSYLGIPWITTIHGDYLINKELDKNRASRIQSYDAIFREVEKNVSEVVCITDMQLLQLKNLTPKLDNKSRLHKIYNGYESFRKPDKNGDKQELFRLIPEGRFVIGMVARGIKEKGWDVLIEAFKKANIDNSWLVLVGGGDEIDRLKNENTNTNIIFVGSVTDPLNYISRFDVACLPSRHPTESLPTSIIEYLYMEKPILASDVGEVSKMLDIGSESPSGIAVSIETQDITRNQLTNAIVELYENKAFYNELKQNTKKSFKKFDMDKCVNGYLHVYNKAIKQSK